MAKPIYKMFLFNWTEAFYQLTQEEQGSLVAKVGQAGEKYAKDIILCDARWGSEQYSFYGVEEYPDIEAVQKHYEELTEIGWFRYVDGISVLGTKFEG